ncbi:MAG TPA: GIY-YIG nuclease family protein [Candidatus Paceibacterota bacterium]
MKSKHPATQKKQKYFVYIVRCADNTLYAGSTKDVARRVEQHNTSKQGARYTKSRRPVTLVYSQKVKDVSAALRREAEIKRLSRAEKEVLVSGVAV